MHRRIHTLADIERILTYVPPLFILLLMFFSIVTAYLVIDHRLESRIALLKQKEQSTRQQHLDHYIAAVRQQITTNRARVQQRLQRDIHRLEGIYRGLGVQKPLPHLRPFLQEMERAEPVNLVLFDGHYTLYYGQKQLEKIEHLIFNNRYGDSTQLNITMMYILSQGKHSALSWKNDLDKTIQLSYFERVGTGDNALYFGAFSRVDDLRSITLHALTESMSDPTLAPKGYYFWLYDHTGRRAFNHQHRGKWEILPTMDSASNARTLGRLFLSVGIARNGDQLSHSIEKIHQELAEKKRVLIAIILTVGILMLLFARTFSNMIRTILRRYNKRLKQAHSRLQRLKERYELAVIASNDGLWDTNFKTGKTFFSQKWLDILGYKPGEIQSFDAWLSLMHPEDTQRVLATLKEHKNSPHKGHMICEYRLRTRSGEYLWMLGRGKVFRDEAGHPHRLIMMSMDISEQKETSERLTRLVEKEVAKNQEKQKLLIQQNKLAAMGEMIGSIAHQWRQPLNNITLILHFIRDNVDNPDFTRTMLDRYVQRAWKQINFMSETIDDFRDFYQPSREKTVFDIEEAIHSTLAIIQPQLDKKSIKVKLSGDSFAIKGHKNEFRQAILNILANAKDAILLRQEDRPNFEGEIHILFGTHRVTLSNNGGPASVEVLERMFEPYFTTKFEDKGTGIGLYMTRAIIENNMQGEIVAANTDDGVAFTITFQGGTP